MERKAPPYRSILFVCDGNTCRSPMAEAILRRMLADFEGRAGKIEVRSGGIASHARDGSDISLDAKLLLKQDGVLVEDFRSKDLKRHRELVKEADLVLTMSQVQKEKVLELEEAEGKGVYTLKEFAGEAGDIDDPFGEEESAYSECKDEIERRLQKVVARLVPFTLILRQAQDRPFGSAQDRP